MESVRNVLHAYGINPIEIQEISPSLFYVRDYQGEYALKISKLTQDTLQNWEYVYNLAYRYNLTDILPIYLTREQNFYHIQQNNIYYLTPWIETKQNEPTVASIFRSVGVIHAQTKKVQNISMESITKQFRRYKKYSESAHNALLTYVEKFEQKHYMAPFELLVCTQYHLLLQVFEHLNRNIDHFIQECEEEEEWNYSLCHGNLQLSHILPSSQTYIINWESAKLTNGIMDLSFFMKNYAQYYDHKPELVTESFSIYMKENELKKSELFLLTIYLLDVKPYLQVVDSYANQEDDQSMMERVRKLQRLYRQLRFAVHFSSYVEDEYNSITLDDLES